jgi:hypothetical protein
MRAPAAANNPATARTLPTPMTFLEWRHRWFDTKQLHRARVAARRHWMFLAVLGAGVLLRVLTQIAYRPALLYIDSYGYLGNIHALSPTVNAQPIGYTLFLLRPVLVVGNLAVVAALQHAIGLAMGVAIYVLVIRLGARRWVAVLAAVPVLLDAYQLQIEQNIMSEPLFQALILAAVVLLLWKRPVTGPTLAIAGVLFGLSATVRAVGGVLIVPAIFFALVAGPGGRGRLFRVATIALAFAVPVGGYAAYYFIRSGEVGFSRGDAYLLYGRSATFVDCRGLDLPNYERVLCPKEPLDERLGVNEYAHDSRYAGRLVPPSGKNRDDVLRDFARRAILHQPVDFARHVLTDFVKVFTFRRTTFPRDVRLERWQFQREYPTHQLDPSPAVRAHGGGEPRVIEPVATFLRGYQLSVGYVPGSFLGLSFVAGLVAAAGVGRARVSGLRAACLLPTLCGVGVLLAADLFQFSWRYQLPALVLAPLAGALAFTALTGWVVPGRESSDPASATRDGRGSPSSAS